MVRRAVVVCMIGIGLVWAAFAQTPKQAVKTVDLTAKPPTPLRKRPPSSLRYLKHPAKLKRDVERYKRRLRPLLVTLKQQRSAIIDEWIKLAEIPAPSKQEQKRATYIAAQFKAAGLHVTIDKMGNVIGHLRGTSTRRPPQRPKGIAYIAHLDTVFDASISHKVRRQGHILHGPGIGDDTSGLIGLVVLARLIQQHKLRFRRDIWLVASVQEEIGLEGARFFVNQHRKRLDAVASIDGGFGGVSYGALGIEWYEVAFHGKGHHTLSSTGRPSTTHAVARAISEIYKLRLPQHPFMRRTWLNVGKLGAGRVFNAQASRAWFTLDLRSMSPRELTRLKKAAFGLVHHVAYQVGVTARIKRVQRFPAAQIPRAKSLYLVQAAKAVLASLGRKRIGISPMGSSDHCTAVALGIPGINIGIIRGSGAHTLREKVDTRYLVRGIQQTAILLALMAELRPVGAVTKPISRSTSSRPTTPPGRKSR